MARLEPLQGQFDDGLILPVYSRSIRVDMFINISKNVIKGRIFHRRKKKTSNLSKSGGTLISDGVLSAKLQNYLWGCFSDSRVSFCGRGSDLQLTTVTSIFLSCHIFSASTVKANRIILTVAIKGLDPLGSTK